MISFIHPLSHPICSRDSALDFGMFTQLRPKFPTSNSDSYVWLEHNFAVTPFILLNNSPLHFLSFMNVYNFYRNIGLIFKQYGVAKQEDAQGDRQSAVLCP